MHARHVAVLGLLVPSLVLAAGWAALGDISGDRGRPTVMQGVARGDDGRDRCRFSVEIERVSFVLNDVRDRYKLARVRVENLGPALALNAGRDRLDLVLASGETVPAVLNLQSGDSAFWDSLSADLRQTMAYPPSVRGRSGEGSSPEVVYIYALFPKDRVTEMPRGFVYRIDSLGQEIRIERQATAARR